VRKRWRADSRNLGHRISTLLQRYGRAHEELGGQHRLGQHAAVAVGDIAQRTLRQRDNPAKLPACLGDNAQAHPGFNQIHLLLRQWPCGRAEDAYAELQELGGHLKPRRKIGKDTRSQFVFTGQLHRLGLQVAPL